MDSSPKLSLEFIGITVPLQLCEWPKNSALGRSPTSTYLLKRPQFVAVMTFFLPEKLIFTCGPL